MSAATTTSVTAIRGLLAKLHELFLQIRKDSFQSKITVLEGLTWTQLSSYLGDEENKRYHHWKILATYFDMAFNAMRQAPSMPFGAASALPEDWPRHLRITQLEGIVTFTGLVQRPLGETGSAYVQVHSQNSPGDPSVVELTRDLLNLVNGECGIHEFSHAIWVKDIASRTFDISMEQAMAYKLEKLELYHMHMQHKMFAFAMALHNRLGGGSSVAKELNEDALRIILGALCLVNQDHSASWLRDVEEVGLA